ncbi:hypothetical protein SDC9_157838 [bioreactor metagenome]|uniref:Bacterial membrane protein YfhO n=1 Tax=bioreactor metagenome TaxID=1076179 RepID=A0A645FDS7_9ZZZZ
MIYGILFALLSTEFFKGVWQTIEPYFNIQFPWRLLDIATILLAVGIGLWATCLVEKYQIKNDDYKIILSILLLLVTNFYFDTQRLNYIVSQTMDVKKEELYDNLYSIGFAFEYLPQSLTDYSIFNHADSALGSDGAVIDGTKDGLSFTFKTDGSTYYDIPFIIYKGYTAFDPATLSTDGLAITDSGNGLVRVTVSDTSIAEITVTYQNTTAQHVSYLISGAAALGTLGFLVYQFRKKSRKADSEKTPV